MIHSQNGNWFTDKGDETVALDWPIDDQALVWEIGGFEGRWAKQMVDKYNPYITIFEPQLWAAERMVVKFFKNDKVRINSFGLWVRDERKELYKYETDGCSIIGEGQDGVPASFVDIYD